MIEKIIDTVLDLISLVSLTGGLFFLFVGTIGLVRMPDVYNRLHAVTKCDTLGAGLILLSLALQSSLTQGIRIILLIIFILLTNPTAAHVIARAAYKTGITPLKGRRLSGD